MKVRSEEGLKTLVLGLGCPKEYLNVAGPVRAAGHIALELWLHRVPENDATKELRRQLLHLDREGKFDYAGQ